MTDVRFVAIDPSFELVATDEPLRHGPAEQREIDRLWTAELAARYDRAGDTPALGASCNRLLDGTLTECAAELVGPAKWH